MESSPVLTIGRGASNRPSSARSRIYKTSQTTTRLARPTEILIHRTASNLLGNYQLEIHNSISYFTLAMADSSFQENREASWLHQAEPPSQPVTCQLFCSTSSRPYIPFVSRCRSCLRNRLVSSSPLWSHRVLKSPFVLPQWPNSWPFRRVSAALSS